MRPVEGVKLNAELTISPDDSDKKRVETLSGRTDALGIATFSVMSPANLGPSDISVTVEGRRGNEVRTVEGSIYIRGGAQILVTTDKPIYQPGQSLKYAPWRMRTPASRFGRTVSNSQWKTPIESLRFKPK
jgi:hypothetical protein